ncbi:MAG: zinc ribbon domain-containing protein [Nitrososphaeria archaeon]|nr:zinc ribbon domain-containing protein [Nitrososphaeria archaeon]
MASLLLGCLISFLGVALVLGSTIYYITLPAGVPIKAFFDNTFMGISYLLYLAIIGSAITVIGLITFVRAARSIEAIAEPGIIARQSTTRGRAMKPRKRMQPPSTGGGIVEEIEREIEEIVKSTEEIVEEKVEEKGAEEEMGPKEAVEVEVVTRGTEMICPSCGTINPLGSKKCSGCKKPLFEAEEDEITCPLCGAPLKLARRISDELFVCGLCFSELKIPLTLQEKIGLT